MNGTSGEILIKAYAIVNGERRRSYGSPAKGFRQVAALWSAYIGIKITSKDVCLMMALLKLARESHRHKEDNLLDLAGYVGLAADLAEGGS